MHALLNLEGHPGKLDHLLLLASLQRALGETADAGRSCEKVLSLDPENREAKRLPETPEEK